MKRAGLLLLTLTAVLMSGVIIAGCTRTVPPRPVKSVPPPTQGPSPTPQVPPAAPQTESAKPPAEGPKATATGPVVKIEAYYPVNADHQYIVDYLKEFGNKHPGQVTVEIYDMQSPEGRKKWTTTDLGCAGVFINGSTHHEITRNGKTEGVDFLKRMDSFWTREDFETVVKQLLEKAKTGK